MLHEDPLQYGFRSMYVCESAYCLSTRSYWYVRNISDTEFCELKRLTVNSDRHYA